MEHIETEVVEIKNRIPKPVLHTLAVVGFVSLVGGGMLLAVYSARFVPKAISGLSTAAVSLSSVFIPNETPTVATEPAATTTEATATTVATSSSPTETTAPTTPAKPAAGQETFTVIGGANTGGSATLSGLPDLIVNIAQVGYYAAGTEAPLIVSNTIPADASGGEVTFIVSNSGSNVVPSGWNFTVSLPSQTDQSYTSPGQPQLLPGERLKFTLGFTHLTSGADQVLSVSADMQNTVAESNDNNNAASVLLTVK